MHPFMMGIHPEKCVSLGNFVAVRTSQNARTQSQGVQPTTIVVLPYFYTTGSAVGLFIPASPQTHEKCIVLQYYDALRSPSVRNFSQLHFIIWDQHCAWGLSLTEISLCNTYLYSKVVGYKVNIPNSFTFLCTRN